MAAEIEKAFADADVQLVRGGRGIFDITCDGDIVYSKYETDRFPNPGELTSILSA